MSDNGGFFAGVYDYVMWPFERAFIGVWRRRLAGGLRGRVLEIGAGTGASFAWYPRGLEVVAVEPSEALPFADASFDVAVGMFTWCSVDDPATGLQEVRRVLKPGGRLVLLEHVHLPWQPGRAVQSCAAPVWEQVAGGCHLDRNTERLVRDAGFVITARRSHILGWILELEGLRAAS